MTTTTAKPYDRHAALTAGKLVIGARVRIAATHLQQTGQHFGPPAPASTGPWARGTITEVDSTYKGSAPDVIAVQWDNGKTRHVLAKNLWPDGLPEPY